MLVSQLVSSLKDCHHTCATTKHKQKPPAFAGGLKPRLLRFAGTDECVRPYARLTLVQQDAFGFFGVYWTVVEFVVFQEDLDEGWSGGDGALDQRF
jgi:hypothetical protein